MSGLMARVAAYGIPFIFANVFVEQLGLPVPALPSLVVAGALAANGVFSFWLLGAAALVATLGADTFWFLLGRRHGPAILKTVCRVSLSPDTCVRQTEELFDRWGLRSLVVAKFIPGFSMVAPPLAGSINTPLLPFLLYDAAGTVLWAGSGIFLGALFHDAIDDLLATLAAMGGRALVFVAVALALFILVKWWQRQRFFRELRTARISPEELFGLIRDGRKPAVVDARSTGARARDPRRIPGAIAFEAERVDDVLAHFPAGGEIVLYCT